MKNIEYVKCLIAKLNKMIEEDEKALKIYKPLEEKYIKCNSANFYMSLNAKERKIWFNHGYIHSKAEYRRVRIELTRALLIEERQ